MHEVGRALYGSNNYGLAGPDSDKDYKVFLCPDFEDLYNCHTADKNDLPKGYDPEHYSVLDVRKFASLVANGNFNALEYLFSRDFCGDKGLYNWCDHARSYYSDRYLMFVWPTFIASLEGLMKNSLSRYGENRKSVSRAYYMYKFAENLFLHNFAILPIFWRCSNFSEEAREMRFNENYLLPSAAMLFADLAKLKEEANKALEFYKNYDLTLFNSFADDKKYMLTSMQLFVRDKAMR